jgi:hypothetical protein
MIQIHDDLNDTMAIPANPDWALGRKPLPILYALSVEHSDRGRFMEIHQHITAEADLREAQAILIRCGAVSYCVDQLLRRHGQAQKILGEISLLHREGLDDLLDEIIAPIKKLFGALGVSDQAISIVEAQEHRPG